MKNIILNDIPVPKNIEIRDITSSSFNVSFNVEKKNIIYFNMNEIKYIIEIKKEKENFKKIYEKNNNNYLIESLDEI